jgi:hypothetical protein
VDVRLLLTPEVHPVRPLLLATSASALLVASTAVAFGGEDCEHCSRSKTTHEALEIAWEEAARVAPPEGGAPAAGKPLLVFVTDGSEAAGLVESAVLGDERVTLGLRAFRAVRMKPEDATKDPWIGKAGKGAVRLVVASADGTRTTVLERATLSASNAFQALRDEAGKVYDADLREVVKKARALLVEFDAIADERKEAAEAPGAEGEARRASLDERQKKADADFRALWGLRPRAA